MYVWGGGATSPVGATGRGSHSRIFKRGFYFTEYYLLGPFQLLGLRSDFHLLFPTQIQFCIALQNFWWFPLHCYMDEQVIWSHAIITQHTWVWRPGKSKHRSSILPRAVLSGRSKSRLGNSKKDKGVPHITALKKRDRLIRLDLPETSINGRFDWGHTTKGFKHLKNIYLICKGLWSS
jgi:hypothetical protein